MAVSALAWLAYYWNIDRPILALAGASCIFLGHALVILLEFVALAVVQRPDRPEERANGVDLLRAYCREVFVTPCVFYWRQPFRSHAEADFVPGNAANTRGIVLVHGMMCNRGFWTPWLKRLRQQRVPFIALNLEPPFGSVDDYVATIDAAVRHMRLATGLAPLLVAHSMGGLAVRSWLSACAGASPAHHVVTIGTPHRGTWLARYALSRNGRQMRQNSSWLRQLAMRETPASHQRYTCFYSTCDNIVFPTVAATLPGADNRHIPGRAHVDLAFDEAVLRHVESLLAPGQAMAAPTGTGR